jgi:hypothetical protein
MKLITAGIPAGMARKAPFSPARDTPPLRIPCQAYLENIFQSLE